MTRPVHDETLQSGDHHVIVFRDGNVEVDEALSVQLPDDLLVEGSSLTGSTIDDLINQTVFVLVYTTLVDIVFSDEAHLDNPPGQDGNGLDGLIGEKVTTGLA